MNDRMNDGNDFLKSNFNYAVVVWSDYTTIQDLKQYLVDNGIEIRYQKISTRFLKIVEGD